MKSGYWQVNIEVSDKACTAFILLTVPVSLFYILAFTMGNYIYMTPGFALGQVIVAIIGTCNYAINFLLYVMTSHSFRLELQHLLSCGTGSSRSNFAFAISNDPKVNVSSITTKL